VFLVFLQFGLLIFLIWLPGGEAPAWAPTVSLVLFLLAGVVLLAAAIALKPSITVMPEPRQDVPFITHGIYRFVRHPMYTGVLLLALAMVVSRWTPSALLVAVLLGVVLATKGRYEDELLRDKWGTGAADYQRSTGSMWPRRR
jgi:protein-S-isoprenylcysteine O-methyltransferase Ste14